MTSWQNESIVFYSRMAELQHKLKKSEEERRDLEKKFNSILHSCQAEQEAKIKSLRNEYTKLLEDDRMRCERNDSIMQTLKKVENRASMITAKTDRLRLLRHHYEAYMSRLYPDWKKELGNTNNLIPQIINSDTGNIQTEYKRNFSMFDPLNPQKHNYLNNLPSQTQSNRNTTEESCENIPMETYKFSYSESPHLQISSDNIIQNKLNASSKPYQLRRKLFEDISLIGTASDEPLYQQNYDSHYESLTPAKLGGYISPEQNHIENNIVHNGNVGDFEMDQNTSDLLSATLSDDITIPKETKSYDFSHSNIPHSPFMYTNKRYSEVDNGENKYSKSTPTLAPASYIHPNVRKPLARTSSFNFPTKSDQENEKYKTSLLTRRPSVLTDNTLSVSATVNKNIRNHSFPKSLINENSAVDSRFKKYLMDTERPYNVKNTYEPRREVLKYTNKTNELMEKEQIDESIFDKYLADNLQKVRSYDNRSVHFESSPLMENEKLKDSGNFYNKYVNRFSKQPNAVRNSEPTWREALKINDNLKLDKNQILNSATENDNIKDDMNKSVLNFHINNSKPVPQRQPTVQNSFSTPNFVFTDYESPDGAKDDKYSILENTDIQAHSVMPNKEKLQEISQEECIQFPKEKLLEQFPEHTSEQFYRLQVVAENPQEQADELKTNDETFQSKLPSEYKHSPVKELQNINKNESVKLMYNTDANTKRQSQVDHVNQNAYSSKKQLGSLGIPRISSDDQLEISRTDNKFYENAIEQLRIETQKSDNLLENNILEQELNKNKTGQTSTTHETKVLEPEYISRTLNQEQNTNNNIIMNNSGYEETFLVDNTVENDNKYINKTVERPVKNNQLGFLYNKETDSEQTGNAELFKLKQEVKLNESEKLHMDTGNSNIIDDTSDMVKDLKITQQPLSTENDVKPGSDGVKKATPSSNEPKEEGNVKFNNMDNKTDSEDFSVRNVQNTSFKKAPEEARDSSDYKISGTNEDSVQLSKENETYSTDNKIVAENNAQVPDQSHELIADSKEPIENNTGFKYDPVIIDNGENETDTVTALGDSQGHTDKINKHGEDIVNEQNIQNINNDQYRVNSGNVSNQNQDYSDNNELAINTHEEFDGSEQITLYSSKPNENEPVFDNVDQQHSDMILEENKDFKNINDSAVYEHVDDESRNYGNYYPEMTENQNGNDYTNQQYYTGQHEEYYPDQNVEGTDYANYNNESGNQYKQYAGDNNETDQYVSDQYGNEMNYQYDKNEYEQQQGNYEGDFDDRNMYTQEHYDDRQQYDQPAGNYQEQYDNREQYEQQEIYNVNQYEEQEGTYNTNQYEQQEGNYQQNYKDGEQYVQQEGDYQHTYPENQHEQGDYHKNYENENQYEQQEGEYNGRQYEQQEGHYQQNYNENNQFVEQENYEQNYNQYEQYNLPEESDGYTSNMQPSDNLQNPGAAYMYSEEGTEFQGDMADHSYRQVLETDVKATTDEHLQPNTDDTDMLLKKQRSLAKVLESDSDSVKLGKDQYNDDSSEFDFSSHNEQNNT